MARMVFILAMEGGASSSRGKLVRGKLIRGKLIRGKLIRGKLIRGKLIRGKLVRVLCGAGLEENTLSVIEHR
jgi:hypothetical protein